MRFRILITISFLFVSRALSLTDNDKQFDSITKEIKSNAYVHGTKARRMVNELYTIANNEPENIGMNMQALYYEVYVNYVQNVNDSSLLSKCLTNTALLDNSHYFFEKALLSYSSALCYAIDANYAKAFSMALIALEQFRTLNDTSFMCSSLSALGNICQIIQNNKMAMEYYGRLLNLTIPQSEEYYSALINLYTCLSYEEQGTSAIDSLISYIPKVEQFQEPELLIALYYNIAALSNQKQIAKETVIAYYRNFMDYIELLQIDNPSVTFGSLYGISSLSLSNNNISDALYYAYEANKVAKHSKNPEQQSFVTWMLYGIYSKVGNIDSAYFYLEQYSAWQRNFINNTKTLEAYQDYISVFLESTQKELTIAEQSIGLKNQYIIIIVLAAIGILLVIAFVLFGVWQKKCSLSKSLEQEQQIRQLQQEKLEFQIREITSSSLQLLNKNDLLQQISVSINQSEKDNKQSIEILDQVKSIIRSNLVTDQVWDDFMVHFNKVHPDFFNRLKFSCGTLTEHNLRMCAYFRIGMTNKQIAQISNISIQSVKMHRHRLRQKFGLDESADLYDFLRNI